MRFLEPRVRRGVAALLVSLAAAGCADDTLSPPAPTHDGALFWSLTLDHRRINLSTVAPYDTITLTATPRDAAGNPIAGLPAPTFRSTDLGHVQVTPDGVVRAIAAGSAIQVVASLTADGLTHADTATIKVTTLAAPPRLASLSIQPPPGDSAKWAMGGSPIFGLTKNLTVVARDTNGTPISGLITDFRSSDPTIGTVTPLGAVTGVRPGRFTIYATTTAYGVTKSDSLPFTIGWPVFYQFFVCNPVTQPTCEPLPTNITIARGGIVLWIDATLGADGNLAPLDLVFDDPTHVDLDPFLCFCGSGNVTTFGTDSVTFTDVFRSRLFNTPGTFPYHSTLQPAIHSQVIVVDESATSSRTVAAR
ncbi:MAG: hypothetical protein IRY91_08820 [Gemmatimonadaceae bacterium]|nr:hypothetical protein [Gemmatimonadaceae bacterium]